MFYLDAETEAFLRAQAKAHGVSQGEIVRARINGHRPGATPGSDAALADYWWDTRTPSRRVSIHRNHASAAVVDPAGDEHQLTIFEGGTPT